LLYFKYHLQIKRHRRPQFQTKAHFWGL